jgi:hypothetical protein
MTQRTFYHMGSGFLIGLVSVDLVRRLTFALRLLGDGARRWGQREQ